MPEVDRPKLNKVSTHVGKMEESKPKLGTHLQKNQIISLCHLRKKLESNSSKECRYTLLPDKTQQKPENKSIPLPDQTQQKYEDPPLSDITKKTGD